MKKEILLAVSALTLSLLLTACGGGSGSPTTSTTDTSTTDTSTNTNNTATNGVRPVTPLTSSVTQTTNTQGTMITATFQSGYVGDIEATSESQTFQGNSFASNTIKLATGIPSLNITDVQRVESIDISCNNGNSGKSTISTDFSSGEVIASGASNGQNLSCKSKFTSPLPTTISNTESILKLLVEFGSDYELSNASNTGLISTNCPQDSEGDNDDIDVFSFVCTGSILTNYTVTDDTGKVHKVSRKISL